MLFRVESKLSRSQARPWVSWRHLCFCFSQACPRHMNELRPASCPENTLISLVCPVSVDALDPSFRPGLRVLVVWTMCVLSHSVVSNSLNPYGLQPTRFLYPWNFPGKSTGVGCHFLLQILKPPPNGRNELLGGHEHIAPRPTGLRLMMFN